MKIVIAADHEGFHLKEELIIYCVSQGLILEDLGTYNTDSTDYPIYAEKVAHAIRDKKADRGILICGSGVGICVAANKISGIRAAICHDTYSAHQGVEHDNMNILVLGAGIIGTKLAQEIVLKFISAHFLNEERFLRRLAQVAALER